MTDDLKFLVVNPIDTLRLLTLKALKYAGVPDAEVMDARNNSEAHNIVQHTEDSMVIIYELPLANSLSELSSFIKSIESYKTEKELNIIVTSLVDTEGLQERIQDLGVHKIVIKTYDIEKFSESLLAVV